MGDEKHAILECPSFSREREKMLKQIEIRVPNFKTLDAPNKVFFMLTSENECANKISKFLNLIYSSKRPNFALIWKKITGSS